MRIFGVVGTVSGLPAYGLGPCSRIPQAFLKMPEDDAAVQEATRLDRGPHTFLYPIKAAMLALSLDPLSDDKDLHGAPGLYLRLRIESSRTLACSLSVPHAQPPASLPMPQSTRQAQAQAIQRSESQPPVPIAETCSNLTASYTKPSLQRKPLATSALPSSPDSSFHWRSLSFSSSESDTKSFATPVLHRALSSYRNAEDRAGSRAGGPWLLMVNYTIIADASLSAVRSTSGTTPAANHAGLDRNHCSHRPTLPIPYFKDRDD
ncbi:hypothetical protein FBULB1_2184 [Fusarium bulbicola]|nr:hypothetical protein FBULB1_2184 [Fusarium bulbicola]